MKICVFHGSSRKGNTDYTLEMAKKIISQREDVQFLDFYFPKDLPVFCTGCFNCFLRGDTPGDLCPHRKYMDPIVDALKESDGIIFGTPVYVLGTPASLKSLLDHLGCIFMVHRPLEEMFKKSALVLSTTAGAGTKHPISLIKRNLNYWGVSKIYSQGFKMYSLDWNSMPEKRRKNFEKKLKKCTYKFCDSLHSKNKASIKTKALFLGMRKLISSYGPDNADNQYWKDKGWFNKNKPWK